MNNKEDATGLEVDAGILVELAMSRELGEYQHWSRIYVTTAAPVIYLFIYLFIFAYNLKAISMLLTRCRGNSS